MAWNILSKIGSDSIKAVLGQAGKGLGSVMDRLGFTEQLSEANRLDKYVEAFSISEKSTDSARQMFIAELTQQKQSFVIKFLNGLVRPFCGLAALCTEMYAIWAESLSVWFKFEYREVTISTEQHLVLGAIVAFYFGSRLSEVVKGVSSKR